MVHVWPPSLAHAARETSLAVTGLVAASAGRRWSCSAFRSE